MENRDKKTRVVSGARLQPEVHKALVQYAKDEGDSPSRATDRLLQESLRQKGYLEQPRRGQPGGRR